VGVAMAFGPLDRRRSDGGRTTDYFQGIVRGSRHGGAGLGSEVSKAVGRVRDSTNYVFDTGTMAILPMDVHFLWMVT